MEWKDASSYSRNDDKSEVKTVRANVGGIQISVTRHIDYPGKWVIRCDPWFNTHQLKSKELDSAKIEASNLILNLLEKAILDIKV